MNIEHLQEVSQFEEKAKNLLTDVSKLEKKAQNLLTDVSKLIEKARRTVDAAERHELYLSAMNKSQKAYSLLATAKKLSGEFPTSWEQ